MKTSVEKISIKKMVKETRNIAILGSTGSIGTQTLDIIEEYPSRFRATVLTARRNWELLARQARKFLPKRVVIADAGAWPHLKEALADLPVEVECGAEAIADAAAMPEVDTVVTAMVGYSGLIPTVKAIEARKTIALANKETLVVAGEIITRMLREHGADIVPVDSEHSAIFQCLQGESTRHARKIILTASGGPFRTLSRQQLENVTVSDALNHPNWSMGAKVTVDSASMMNKGFEMIEACHLFDVDPSMINIVVHPESIIHSMVEFEDGAVIAQMGCPDMREPIGLALSFPDRLSVGNKKLDFASLASLHFEAPDESRFPNLGLARSAFRRGGNIPCVLNAANEVAVKAFLEGQISFYGISDLIEHCLNGAAFVAEPSLEDIFETHEQTIRIAQELI